MAVVKNWPDRLIPANPADLNFEAELRSNTRQMLDAVRTFDQEFVDSINALGGTTLASGMQDLRGDQNQVLNEFGEMFKADDLLSLYQSVDPYHPGVSQVQTLGTISVTGPFESLDKRFFYLDTIINDAFSKDIIQPTVGTVAPNSIHARFSSAEQRLKDSEDLLTNAYTLSLQTGASFTSIEDRFSQNEQRTTDAEDLLENAFTLQLPTGLTFVSIEDRFSKAEQRIKAAEDLLDNAYLTVASGVTYTSIEDRFDQGETRITDIESELDAFTGASTLASVMANYYTQSDVDNKISSVVPLVPSSSSAAPGVNPIKYLTSVNGAQTWQDLPWVEDASGNIIDITTGAVVAPNLQALYDSWVPDVPFQTMQFFGEIKSSRVLAAGFNYFVAGNLHIPNGVTLTLSGGVKNSTQYIPGATLVIQGHVLGNLAGIVLGPATTCPPKVIVQNWSTTRSTYLINENDGDNGDNVVLTSYLNLEGKHIFPAPLEIVGNAELWIDNDCQLVFKNADAATQAKIQFPATDANGDPLGSVIYMDEQLAQITAINNLAAEVQKVGDDFAALIQKFADLSQDHFVFEDKSGELHVHYNQGLDPAKKVTQQEVDDLIDDWKDLMEGFDPAGAMSISQTAVTQVANEMKDLFLKLEAQVNRYTYSVSTDGQTITYDFTQQPIATSDITDWVDSWEDLIINIRDSIGSLEQLQLLIG